jgi:uncharacterized membrane protein
MAIAVLALVNALLALYLHLYKLGKVGALACSSGGGCQVAQFSQYGWFLGVDVAMIGFVGYTFMFVCALVALQPSTVDTRWTNLGAFLIIVPAVLFTWRLKYGEWVVLRTFCPWCFVSFLSIHTCLVLAILDRRRLRRGAPPPADEPASLPVAA